MKVILPNPNDENSLEVVQIDEWDTWNMDYTLSLLIVPMLKQLKQDGHGYPANLNSVEAWHDILDKMIWSFEQSLDHYESAFDIDKADWKEQQEKMQDGFRLFAEYYTSLWD